MRIFALTVLFLLLFNLPQAVFAQGVQGPGGQQQNSFRISRLPGFGIDISGGNPTGIGNIGFILKNVITLFFTVGGLGFTIMILWGAVDWILSGGDKEKVAGARKRIITAVTGLTILSLSFIIMLIAGQILSINALQFGTLTIPGLGAP